MNTVYLSHPHQLNIKSLQPTVMALGFFDGVHLGHQKVIGKAKEIADQAGIMCSVMTFNPHPKEVLQSGKTVKKPMNYLSPLKEKEKRIAELGVDTLYVVQFEQSFADLTPQQFVDDYLIQLNVKHVVAGFDYTYGKLGKGTMETLPFHSRNQFTQTTIEKVETKRQKISSTLIRQLLNDGQVEQLPNYLGRLYEIEGTVVDGDKRGRKIGFPTANIQTVDRYYLPAAGVYAVRLKLGQNWYEGVCNLGFKPTFHNGLATPTIEVHLFNFNKDIYGELVTVQWLTYLRSEKKFSSIDELVKQINEDKQKALTYFNQQ
ncbi:bifunctional riboflavin kinase/FAD synthetase [Anaerobacillus sp. MEB173]|uniref:bifunctional riboflavin kinase/FAD synthetase n=1 Tax=Anaerobacillus sp. MEB173 TaxID=3383345 RepID=UPI003F924906